MDQDSHQWVVALSVAAAMSVVPPVVLHDEHQFILALKQHSTVVRELLVTVRTLGSVEERVDSIALPLKAGTLTLTQVTKYASHVVPVLMCPG